jgi:hypothetical protein
MISIRRYWRLESGSKETECVYWKSKETGDDLYKRDETFLLSFANFVVVSMRICIGHAEGTRFRGNSFHDLSIFLLYCSNIILFLHVSPIRRVMAGDALL